MQRPMRYPKMVVLVALEVLLFSTHVEAFTAQQLQINSEKSVTQLYSTNKKAKILGKKAYAVLVFPQIIKAGFFGASQRGDGALIRNGKAAGYYNISAGSYGIQAGIEVFSSAIFFMTPDSIKSLEKADGFSIGTEPTLTIVDVGVADTLSSMSLQKGIYAFFYSQKGLMAGLGLQAAKITKYTPSK